jgi:hypothetical protein
VKGGKQKLAANTLLHVVAEDRVFDVVQDPSTKAFVMLDLARRDELAKARLAKTGHELWDEPSREVREETIEEAKKRDRIQPDGIHVADRFKPVPGVFDGDQRWLLAGRIAETDVRL